MVRGHNAPMNQHPCRGFTIIELMVVVAVVGILAVVALPNFQDYTARARVAEAFGLAQPIQKTVRDYHDRWGAFPASNAAAGLHAAETYAGQYIKSIRVEQGVISITLNPIDKLVGGQELHLTPAVNEASATAPFAWVCEGRAPPAGMKTIAEIPPARLTLLDKYLPAGCRRRP
jgi:type IV pilus assembly protein PilA